MGTFIAINTLRKKGSQINNLTWHLKELEKGELNPKLVEVIKIMAEINEIENTK